MLVMRAAGSLPYSHYFRESLRMFRIKSQKQGARQWHRGNAAPCEVSTRRKVLGLRPET